MNEDPLFEQVKGKLCVTWDDARTDARIRNVIMPSAEQDLRDLLGIDDPEFSFADAGTENILFLAHCYYEWSNAADEFEEHYSSMIARCRRKWMVKQYVEGQKPSPGLP